VRIEPEQYRTVGACLAAARRRANLTQTEAAERLGRKQTFVSEIERGLRRVDVIEIVLISRALEIDPLQLFAEVTNSSRAGLKAQKPKRQPRADEPKARGRREGEP
jgi:transcriptional regulator with XRE-family HTH domain